MSNKDTNLIFYLLCESMSDLKNIVYLSLGSNVGNKKLYLQKAVYLLDELLGKVEKVSGVYQSESWGFKAADFYNICVMVETDKNPEATLVCIQEIESILGRERKNTTGYHSRTLDIDMLFYNNLVLDTQALSLPHPALDTRNFVLKPLVDIAPDLHHPTLKKTIRELEHLCNDKIAAVLRSVKITTTPSLDYGGIHFIAIEGNIGAGKTSLATLISEHFNGKLLKEQFADNPFLPKFYQDKTRYAFPLEMSFLAERYQQYTDSVGQLELFKDFMVSDYDIYKSLIFAQITLEKEEYKLYRKLFTIMYQEAERPDIYVFLNQTTERLLENIKTRGRSYELEIQASYLEQINKGYVAHMKSSTIANHLIIDVSEKDFVKNPADYREIVDAIFRFSLRLPNP